MTQVSKLPLRKEIADRIFEIFLITLINLRQKDEAEQLIQDLFTPTERVMLAKRLAIAFLLEKGHDYQTIKSLLRVSSATIASVNMQRQSGGKGYQQCIAKIMQEESLQNFFAEIALKLIQIPASSTKGSGTWRYLEKELKNNLPKRKKSF